MYKLMINHPYSLIPRPRPAFHHLQFILQVMKRWAGPGNIFLTGILTSNLMWQKQIHRFNVH